MPRPGGESVMPAAGGSQKRSRSGVALLAAVAACWQRPLDQACQRFQPAYCISWGAWAVGCGEGKVAGSHAMSARAAYAACWGEGMRGGQSETYRGSCSRSPPIMPYNLDATQTRSSDSMVGPWTASRPHPKSTPGRSPKAFCQSVREPLVRIYGALKGSLIYMDTWQARTASGPFNSESECAAVRFPHEAAQQVTRGIAARRLEGGVRPAALLRAGLGA